MCQHIGITPCPRSDPAPGQLPQPAHSPGMRPAGNTARIDHHSAQVAPVGVAPAQGQAGPRAPPRNQHTQRARLRQATQATAVARRPLNGLGGRLGVQPYNRGCRGWRRWHGLQKSKKIGFCCCSRAARMRERRHALATRQRPDGTARHGEPVGPRGTCLVPRC